MTGKKKELAIAIVDTGWTSSYDPETYECEHEAYCGLITVELNQEFWDHEFGENKQMNEAVHTKYDLEWGFKNFKITVFPSHDRGV